MGHLMHAGLGIGPFVSLGCPSSVCVPDLVHSLHDYRFLPRVEPGIHSRVVWSWVVVGMGIAVSVNTAAAKLSYLCTPTCIRMCVELSRHLSCTVDCTPLYPMHHAKEARSKCVA